MINKTRIGIVGAGAGGLAAAALLARRGFDVTVFERADRAGGRNSALKAEGYTFDVGPTFFTLPFVLEEIFAECGKRLADEVELKALNPHYRLVFSDGHTFQAGPDPEKVKVSIRRINPADARGFDRYLAYQRQKMEAILPCLKMPFESWADLAHPAFLRALPFLNLSRSLWGHLGRFFQDDRVKAALSFDPRSIGMSPFQSPALFSWLSYGEHRWGVYHPMGGCNALSRALERLARDLGAKIELNADVVQVVTAGGAAKALDLADGRRLTFDEIIVNADFAWAMRNLIPDQERRRYTDANLDKKRHSHSTFMLYLGLDKLYGNLPHHSIFLPANWREKRRGNSFRRRPPDDLSLYVQNASVTDPGLAPAGHSTLYVLAPVANLQSGIDWEREKQDFRGLLLKNLAEQAGLNDLEKHIRFERVVTPRDWQDNHRLAHGAAFSLSHNLGQMFLFRPHNRFEEFGNMWLVGGGTHPGAGLPNVYLSARITADGIIKKYSGLAPAAVPASIVPPKVPSPALA